MNWQSVLKAFRPSPSENRSEQLVSDWTESLTEVMMMYDDIIQAGFTEQYLHYHHRIHTVDTLQGIYNIIVEELRYMDMPQNHLPENTQRLNEKLQSGMEQLKEDMEWNFGDN